MNSSNLLEFCKLAQIDCSSNDEKIIIKNIDSYLSKYRYTPRYLKNLTPEEKFFKKIEIKYYQLVEKTKGKKMYQPTLSDKIYLEKHPKKISKYTQKWNKMYDARTLEEKSEISGVPLDLLKKVYNKGLAAWRGSSHRPGAGQHEWGVSRVNSFLTCGKTFYFPDHLIAGEAIKRSSKAKNFFKKCKK